MALQHRSRSVIHLTVLLIITLCLSALPGSRAIARTDDLAKPALHVLAGNVLADRLDVTLTDSGFLPASLTIFEGTSVVWHNATSQAQVLEGLPRFQVFVPAAYHAQQAAALDREAYKRLAAPDTATNIFSTILLPQTTFQYTFTNHTELSVEVAANPQLHSRIIVQRRPVDIDIKIIQPNANVLQGDTMPVVAVVESLYEVASISASANGRTTPLEYRAQAYFDKAGWHAGWVGDLDLAGTPRGASQLTLRVVDVYGGTAQVQQPFTHDQKPRIAISAPLDSSVAQPQLSISATCIDDDPQGCASLRVTARRNEFANPASDTLLASGKASVAANVDLSAFSGSKTWITFQATDSAGQNSEQTRFVFVEASSYLTHVEDVGGPILDVQTDRILFLDQSAPIAVLKIRQRVSGQDSAIASIASKTPQYGFLTPKGAIFIAQGIDVTTAGVYDWRDNQLISLGQPNSANSLRVKGNYAIWSGNNGDPSISVPALLLRDLVNGTTIIVSTVAGNTDNDLAANGDVVYWTSYGADPYNMYRYHQGSSSKITNDTVLWNVYPRTDGSTIVYRKIVPCCGSPPNTALMLYQTSEVTLTANLSYDAQPDQDYQVSNGWVAFTKLGTGGQRQVWRRAANGSQEQLTFFGISSVIDALAPNGEIIVISASRRYLIKLGTPAVEIGSSLGHSFWQNGSWFVTLGRTLFQINA